MAGVLFSTECGSCEAPLAMKVYDDEGRVAIQINGVVVFEPVTVDGDDLTWNCPRCGSPDAATVEAAAARPLL